MVSMIFIFALSHRPEDVMNSYYKNVYIKPYCRMGPYIIGILVGYLILHKKELTLTKVIIFFSLNNFDSLIY